MSVEDDTEKVTYRRSIRRRRTVREFKLDPVPEEVLLQIFEREG